MKINIDMIITALKLKPKQAVEYFKKKGVKLSANFEQTAELIKKQSWSVSGVTKMRILQDTKASLIKAIEQGTTFKEWVKGLNSFYSQNGWLPKDSKTSGKIGTVYQTNVHSAYNDGRFEQQQATAEVLPYVQYVATMDSSTTTECKSLNGKIFRKDDENFNENYRPPRHYNCRSRLRTVPNSVAKKIGVSESSDYKADIADKEFQGKNGSFSFTPKKKDYNPKLFNDFQTEMKTEGF